MSYTYYENQDNRSGSRSLDDRTLHHNYTRSFVVETGDSSVCAGAVIDGLVATYGFTVGQNYSSGSYIDLQSLLVGMEASCMGGGVWEVRLNYETRNPCENQPNPLFNCPVISWDYADYQRVLDIDTDGKPIVATNGMPFEPGVEVDRTRAVARIERNEADKYDSFAVPDGVQTFSASLAWSMIDTVNMDAFAGADPGHAKISHISASSEYSPLCGKFWRVSYEIQFTNEEHGFQLRVNNLGFYTVVGGLYKQIFIDGVPAAAPLPLTADGSGFVPPPVSADDVITIDFKVYPESDFSTFNFDEELFGV